MKASLLIALMWSNFGFASSFVSLDCKTATPCAHTYQSGLKYCVSSISLSGRIGSRGTEMIYFSPMKIGQDLKLLPQQESVIIKKSASTISFSDENGDNWGELKSDLRGNFVGTITVDQDFEFQVACTNKALGFE